VLGGALVQLIVILVCLMLAALASAAETSLTGVRRSRIQQLAEEEHNKRAQLVFALVKTPWRFLTTILVLNSVAVIVASSVATELALSSLPAHPAWLRNVAASVVMAVLVLIFAEITPKIIAIQGAERWSLRLGPLVRLLAVVLGPIVAVLSWLASGIARLTGTQSARLDQLVTEEELRLLVEVSERQGQLLEAERQMIHGVFEFGDTLVREVMRPRIDVTAVEVNTPFQEVLGVAMEAGHSRIPMYEDSIDNVVGVLYAKDLLRYLLPEKQSVELKALARPPYFVPESQKVDQVFREMRTKKVHMAIVLDEYGGTAGIVTIEDLLEEIVGEIQDEYDTEAPAIEQAGDGVFVVDGSVTMGTIGELLDLDLESQAYDTIGGLVYSQLGAAPQEGATTTVGQMQATVVEMDGRRVRRVRIERRTSGGPSGEESPGGEEEPARQ